MRVRSAGPRRSIDIWEVVVLAAVPTGLFGANFFYGAYLPIPALLMAALSALALALALTQRGMRQDLANLKQTWSVWGLFLMTVAAVIWSLTPWTPGGPHPLWSWAGLPAASTIDRSGTSMELIKLSGQACLFVLGCICGARSKRATTTMAVVLAVGAIYAFLSLLIFLSGFQAGFAADRLLGGFQSPNAAATVLGMLLILSAAWALRAWRRGKGQTVTERLTEMAPVTAACLLFLACLMLTASRAGVSFTILALVALFAWEVLQRRQSFQTTLTAVALIGGGLALLVLIGTTTLITRFVSVGPAIEARGVIIEAHWRAFLNSPLFGYGLGSYSQVNNQIMTAENFAALSETTALHNAYLQWLEEGGLVTAVPMFALVLLIVITAIWRAIARPSGRTILGGLLAASLFIALHAAIDVPLQMPSIAGLWAFLLGLTFAFAQAVSSVRR